MLSEQHKKEIDDIIKKYTTNVDNISEEELFENISNELDNIRENHIDKVDDTQQNKEVVGYHPETFQPIYKD
jgi:hypothetical protein